MSATDASTFEDLTPTELAKCFATVLRQWLTDSEMSEINTTNADGGYDPATCASHDYCDSNMAMLEAISNLTGIPVGDIDVSVSDAPFCDLLNEAWAIAKRAEFDARRIVTS